MNYLGEILFKFLYFILDGVFLYGVYKHCKGEWKDRASDYLHYTWYHHHGGYFLESGECKYLLGC